MARSKVRIEICGRSYTVGSEEGEEHIVRLADYVDRKMREISELTSTISSLDIAVLTALNIADEMFKLREQAQVRSSLAEEKVSNLLNLLKQEG